MSISLNTLLRRERPVAVRVPYTSLVSPHNVRTVGGDLVSVIKLDGAAYESIDPDDLAIWHEQLHSLLLNLCGPDVALWRTTIRREIDAYPGGEPHGYFARQFDAAYRAKFSRERMMVNDLYLTFVLRGPPKVSSLFGGASNKKARTNFLEEVRSQSERLDELIDAAMEGLHRYQPQRLGNYQVGEQVFNSALEFLSRILNGDWTRVRPPRAPLNEVLPTSRISFGVETGEIRSVLQRQRFAMLSIKEYPEETATGILNQLLSLPFEYVLTQSFVPFDREKALSAIKSQENKLSNSKDPAESQLAALSIAADDLASNRIRFGEHHFSLLITADSENELVERLSMARSNLSESYFTVVRDDIALEASYWAQMPAVFTWRPSPTPISSRNYAGMIAMHNYPVGQRENNEWGHALMLVKTMAGSPYYLNLHKPKRDVPKIGMSEEDLAEQRVPGNTFLCGPTGMGKTVVQGALLTMSEKYQPTSITFDKDNGLEGLICALGGQYKSLKIGAPTGMAPFMREDTPAARALIEALIFQITAAGDPLSLTTRRKASIASAIDGMFKLPMNDRRLSTFRQFLDPSDDTGPHAVLGRWCDGGPLSWVFDNEVDTLRLAGTRHFGFDITHFLQVDEVRVPIIMYLFDRAESLIGKTRTIINVAEFWKTLQDPWLESKTEDLLKTIRKRNGYMFLETQSPKDAINSRIAHTVMEQSVSQIYLPNPQAKAADYIDGFGLSERELHIVKHTMVEENLRGFLFKQDKTSTICDFNLRGMNDELAVISSTQSSVELIRKAIERVGPDPEIWLPVFHQMRRG